MSVPSKAAVVRGASRGIGAAIARRLAESGFAVVVNYVSNNEEADNVVASITGAGGVAYAVQADISKAAVEALTRSLSKELGTRRIRVNAVAPGPTDTGLLDGANTAERTQSFRDMTPLGRLGEPDDIANVITFLSRPNAAWINGQTIRVNGGIVA